MLGDVSIQVLQIDDVTIKISALKAIFDQLMVFGIEPFKTTADEALQSEGAEISTDGGHESKDAEDVAAAARNVLRLLSDFLDSEVRENRSPPMMRCLPQHVRFCSLLFLGRSLNLANISNFAF